MSRLSTHLRRRNSCIAMLTSGWRSPVAFSISTDVVSSRFDRKTSVLAMFRERPVSMSRSTRVSSLRLRRTSLLVCISPPIINLTIYISSDGRDAARCGTRFRDDSGGRDVFDLVLWLAAICSLSEASNPLIEGLRCIGAPVGLHEDAPDRKSTQLQSPCNLVCRLLLE